MYCRYIFICIRFMRRLNEAVYILYIVFYHVPTSILGWCNFTGVHEVLSIIILQIAVQKKTDKNSWAHCNWPGQWYIYADCWSYTIGNCSIYRRHRYQIAWGLRQHIASISSKNAPITTWGKCGSVLPPDGGSCTKLSWSLARPSQSISCRRDGRGSAGRPRRSPDPPSCTSCCCTGMARGR